MTEDNKNKEENKAGESADTDDMSLADLLGGDTESEDSGPKRVDQRDDEPGSGVVKLADMVASSSVDQAKTPSIAPPPPDDTTGSIASGLPEGSSGASPLPAAVPAAAPAPAPKSSGAIYALIAVVVIAGAAIVYFVMDSQKKSQEKDQALASLQAEVNKVKEAETEKKLAAMQAQLEEVKAREEQARAEAEAARVAAEKAAKEKAAAESESQEGTDGESTDKATDAKDSSDKEAAAKEDTASAKGKSSPKSKKGRSVKKEAPSKAAKTRTPKASKPEPAKTASKSAPKKGDELDALLGGKKKKEESKKAAPSGPTKPTKVDVKTAMGPVSARAKSCAKYSTGTVQLKITVGSNGRVKSSKAMGSFAGTTAGKCVEMIGRTAKFSAFSDPKFTFTYPITLR